MAEKSFPFSSVDEDRKYGSADFRSFFRTLMGNGRTEYNELDITDPKESLLFTADSLDFTRINGSIGACLVNGALYQTDEAIALNVELPTGSSTRRGSIVARIDETNNRKITILATLFAPVTETDLVLATFTANSSKITEVVNTDTVAYSKYQLNAAQQFKLVLALASDPTLINLLGQNPALADLLSQSATLIQNVANDPTLITAVVNNPNLVQELGSNPVFLNYVYAHTDYYTFVIDSSNALKQWIEKDSRFDYTRVLILTGSYIYSSTASTVINLSDGKTTKITGQKGSKITVTVPTYTTPVIANGNGKTIIEGVTVETNGVAFYNCSDLTDCTGLGGKYSFQNCQTLYQCRVNGADHGGFYGCVGLFECGVSTSFSAFVDGTHPAGGFVSCKDLMNCTATLTNTMSMLFVTAFDSCERMENCDATTTYISASIQNLFNACKYLRNCYGKIVSGSVVGGTRRAIFTNCRGLQFCTGSNPVGNGNIFNTGTSTSGDGACCAGPSGAGSFYQQSTADNATYGYNTGKLGEL